MGKNGSITEAGNPGSPVFVNQNVCLTDEANVNRVTQACKAEEDIPTGGVRGLFPDRAWSASTELLLPTVTEKHQMVDGQEGNRMHGNYYHSQPAHVGLAH